MTSGRYCGNYNFMLMDLNDTVYGMEGHSLLYIKVSLVYSSFFVPFLETLRFFITINEKIIIKTKILNGCIKYIKIKLQIENLLFTLIFHTILLCYHKKYIKLRK